MNEKSELLAVEYGTGEILEGRASVALLEASTAAEPVGAVCAYLQRGVWEPLDPARADDYRRMGHVVATVYAVIR